MESQLTAKTREVKKFEVFGMGLFVFSLINSDPIDTRKTLSERKFRILTVPEIIFFSQQNPEFAKELDGKWFRVDLIKPEDRESADNRNRWILRFGIYDSGKLNYHVEEDRPGIILKRIVGIDKKSGLIGDFSFRDLIRC
jgi:hypothetical protein